MFDTIREEWKCQWDLYLRTLVLVLGFVHSKITMITQQLNRFGMINCSSPLPVGWLEKLYFNSKKTDEPVYSYIDKYLCYFVGQSEKSYKVWNFNQRHQNANFKLFEEELRVEGEFLWRCRQLNKLFSRTPKQKRQSKWSKKLQSIAITIKKRKRNELRKKFQIYKISGRSERLNCDNLSKAFDAYHWYTSAISEETSIKSKFLTGFSHTYFITVMDSLPF